MKIVFLNAWNAKMLDNITDFIKQQTPDTDVFCFQEAYDDMKLLCQDILHDYAEVAAYKFVTDDDDFPQVTYVKKDIHIAASGTILAEEKNTGLGIYVQCEVNSTMVNICNFHGMSRPIDKLDNPERLKASQELINFFRDTQGIRIIGGDFNIFPETQSIQMFAENGYRDLINDYKIENTRNRLAWEMYPDNKQYYSDYAFVDTNAEIKDFTVPVNEVSDHLPLILEIEI